MTEQTPPSGKERTGLGYVLAAGIYLVLHLLLEMHAHAFRSPLTVTAWYPPLGLALSYFLCRGRNSWPVVALGFFLGVLLVWGTHSGWVDALRIALSNTFAAWLGAQLLKRRSDLMGRNWGLGDLAAVLGVAALMGIVSGALILGYWALAGQMEISRLPPAFGEWILGDMIGIMLIAPLALVILAPFSLCMQSHGIRAMTARWMASVSHRPERLLEALAFVLVNAAIIFWVFLSQDARDFNLFFLCFLPVLWAVLRYGFVGATLTAAGIDILGLTAILYFGVPGGMSDNLMAVHYFQLFVMMLAIIAYTLGITLDRLRHAREALDRQSRNLEGQVERRTSQLASEIEERRHAEDKLRRLNDSLEQRVIARTEALNDARKRAERANEAKTHFLQNMSHELRTPLNAVIGFAQILEAEMLGPLGSPKYKDYARDINKAGSHLLSLVGDLLEMASLTGADRPLHLEPCSLRHVLDAVRVMAEPRATETGVGLAIDRNGSDIRLMADHPRLVQVLLNLVGNAIKFTPRGGHVDMAFRLEDGDAIIEISDTGPGIAKEDLPHIFDRFWRGSRSELTGAGGMGLGLPIAKSLAERHGGSLVIESRRGKGTRAIVRLPAISAFEDHERETTSISRP